MAVANATTTAHFLPNLRRRGTGPRRGMSARPKVIIDSLLIVRCRNLSTLLTGCISRHPIEQQESAAEEWEDSVKRIAHRVGMAINGHKDLNAEDQRE